MLNLLFVKYSTNQNQLAKLSSNQDQICTVAELLKIEIKTVINPDRKYWECLPNCTCNGQLGSLTSGQPDVVLRYPYSYFISDRLPCITYSPYVRVLSKTFAVGPELGIIDLFAIHTSKDTSS